MVRVGAVVKRVLFKRLQVDVGGLQDSEGFVVLFGDLLRDEVELGVLDLELAHLLVDVGLALQKILLHY